jgi:hypothetical protein
MSVAVTQGFPASITIGDSVSFTINDSDHPVATWPTAQVVFRNGTTVKTFKGAISDLDQLFALTGTNTDTLKAGRNFVAVIYTDADGNRESTDWQEIIVFADPTKALGSTFASRSLANIEAAIEKLSAGTNETVNFNGQSFTKKDIKTLMAIRDQFKDEVDSEQSGLDLGISRSSGIRVRFAAP